MAKRKRGGDDWAADDQLHPELWAACESGDAPKARGLLARLTCPALFLDYTPHRSQKSNALEVAIGRHDPAITQLLLELVAEAQPTSPFSRKAGHGSLLIDVLRTEDPGLFQILRGSEAWELICVPVPSVLVEPTLRLAADFPDEDVFGQLLAQCPPFAVRSVVFHLGRALHVAQLVEHLLGTRQRLTQDEVNYLCEKMFRLWTPELAGPLWRMIRQHWKRFLDGRAIDTLSCNAHLPGVTAIASRVVNHPEFDLRYQCKKHRWWLDLRYDRYVGMDHRRRTMWIKLLMASDHLCDARLFRTDNPPVTQMGAMHLTLVEEYCRDPDTARQKIRRELRKLGLVSIVPARMFCLVLCLQGGILVY